MKKFSALLCIALFITFGGVYAAWTYSTATATPGSATNFEMNMEVIEDSQTPYGSLSVEHDASITIDDANGTTKHATDAGDLAVDGTFTITFTPADLASSEIKASGIDLVCTLTSTAKYGTTPANIFTISNNGVKQISKASATKNDDGTFTYTVDLIDFGISLNSFSLTTPTEARAFATALNNAFTFSVVDAASASAGV